jgi:hypothetical protein
MVLGVLGFLAAAFFLAVGSAAAQGAQPAPDFAFRFEFKPCTTNILDTYEKKFIRGMGPADTVVSIPLELSQEQMTAVYEAIANIRFFEYPTTFVGGAGLGETITTTPSTSYQFEVRNAGVVHRVSWDDAHSPRSEAANRLLNLFKMIIGFINDHPDVKRLPTPRVRCE